MKRESRAEYLNRYAYGGGFKLKLGEAGEATARAYMNADLNNQRQLLALIHEAARDYLVRVAGWEAESLELFDARTGFGDGTHPRIRLLQMIDRYVSDDDASLSKRDFLIAVRDRIKDDHPDST